MRNFFLLAAAPLALAACTEPAAETETAAGTDTATATAMQTDTAMAEPAAASAATPTDPQGFVNAAAASDMFEMETGKLAQANGQSAAVKEFGAMMVRDHTKSTADLKTAASSANVTPAAQMNAKQQADLAALQAAGASFDTLYKQQQITAHQEALALHRNQADNGTAASLKAFAAATAPVVQGHLEQLQSMR